jgi:2-octaprenyl-6-methoxyphenol hydroxylase
LSAAQKQGHAIGDLEVLLNYEQQQKLDQKMTIGFSDKITELFANQNPLVSLARNMGLLAMDLVPELKDSFVSHAAGQAGLADWPYKELTQ